MIDVNKKPLQHILSLSIYFQNITLKEQNMDHCVQKVALPEYFNLEKILKEKQIGGKKHYFVQWLDWPEKFNSWVSGDQLIEK